MLQMKNVLQQQNKSINSKHAANTETIQTLITNATGKKGTVNTTEGLRCTSCD